MSSPPLSPLSPSTPSSTTTSRFPRLSLQVSEKSAQNMGSVGIPSGKEIIERFRERRGKRLAAERAALDSASSYENYNVPITINVEDVWDEWGQLSPSRVKCGHAKGAADRTSMFSGFEWGTDDCSPVSSSQRARNIPSSSSRHRGRPSTSSLASPLGQGRAHPRGFSPIRSSRTTSRQGRRNRQTVTTPKIADILEGSNMSQLCPKFDAGLPCNNPDCMYRHKPYDMHDYFYKAQMEEIPLMTPVHVNALQRRVRNGSPFGPPVQEHIGNRGRRRGSVSPGRRGSGQSGLYGTLSPPGTAGSYLSHNDVTSRPETPHAATRIQLAWKQSRWLARRQDAVQKIQMAWRLYSAKRFMATVRAARRLRAAQAIQTWIRTVWNRTKFLARILSRLRLRASIVIESAYRGHLGRLQVRAVRNNLRVEKQIIATTRLQRWWRRCQADAFIRHVRALKLRRENMTRDIMYVPRTKLLGRVAAACRAQKYVLESVVTFACSRLVSSSRCMHMHFGEGLESLAWASHLFPGGFEPGCGELVQAKEVGLKVTSAADLSGNVRAESVVVTSACCTMEVKGKCWEEMPDGQGVYPRNYFASPKVFLCTQARVVAGQMLEIHAFRRGKYFVFEAFEHHKHGSRYRGSIVSPEAEMVDIFGPLLHRSQGSDGEKVKRPQSPSLRKTSSWPKASAEPLHTLVSVLRRGRKDKQSGLRTMSVGELGSGIKRAYGRTYGQLYRKKFSSMTHYISNAAECQGVLDVNGQMIRLLLKDDQPKAEEIRSDSDETFFFVSDFNLRPIPEWREVNLDNLENVETFALESTLFSLLPIHNRIIKLVREGGDSGPTATCVVDSTAAVVKFVEAMRAFKFVAINSFGEEQPIGLRVHEDLVEQLGTSLAFEESPSSRPVGLTTTAHEKREKSNDVGLARKAMASAIIVGSTFPVSGDSYSAEKEEWNRKRNVWWEKMCHVHPHARFSTWSAIGAACLRGTRPESQRVLFIPPIQLRRMVSYQASLKMNAIFLIKAQFHPIQQKILGARRRFHRRSSLKWGSHFRRWLEKTRVRVAFHNACAVKIQANVRKLVYKGKYIEMQQCSLMFQKLFRGWKGRRRVEHIRELLVGDWPKVEIMYERGVHVSGIQLHLRIWRCGLHYLMSGYDHLNCEEYKGFVPRWEVERLCKRYPYGMTGQYSLRKRIHIRPTFSDEVMAMLVGKLSIVEPIKGLGELEGAMGTQTLVVDGDGRGKHAGDSGGKGIQSTYVWRPPTTGDWIDKETEARLAEEKRSEILKEARMEAARKKRRHEGRETAAERKFRLEKLQYEDEMREWKEKKNQWPRGKVIVNEIWEWYRHIVNVMKVLTTSEERGPLRAARIRWTRIEANVGGVAEKMKRHFAEMDPLRTGYVPSWELETNLYWLGEIKQKGEPTVGLPLSQISNFIEEALYSPKGSKVNQARDKFMEKFSTDMHGITMVSRLPGNLAGYVDYNDFVDRMTSVKPPKHPYKSMMRNMMLKYKQAMNDPTSALRRSEEKISASNSALAKRKQKLKAQADAENAKRKKKEEAIPKLALPDDW